VSGVTGLVEACGVNRESRLNRVSKESRVNGVNEMSKVSGVSGLKNQGPLRIWASLRS
jgi:hypothetical protein